MWFQRSSVSMIYLREVGTRLQRRQQELRRRRCQGFHSGLLPRGRGLWTSWVEHKYAFWRNIWQTQSQCKDFHKGLLQLGKGLWTMQDSQHTWKMIVKRFIQNLRCLFEDRTSPVWDARKDEEGTADRGGKSHKARREKHSCTKIKVLKVQSRIWRT